jgi:hypothetical protein
VSHPDTPSRGRSPNATGRDVRSDDVYIAVIQLQGKVDALIQTSAIRDDAFVIEIKRIREDWVRDRSDHEDRIRKLEERRYVEPKTVWTAFGIMLTFGSLIVAIINLATR